MSKNKFNIKLFVEKILEEQNKVITILEHKISENYTDEEIIALFERIDNSSYFLNSAISKKIADYLQLLNEKNNYESVSLETIKRIYEGLIRINPTDINLFESFAWYLDSVMDSSEQAKLLLMKGINNIETKIKNLKENIENIQ